MFGQRFLPLGMQFSIPIGHGSLVIVILFSSLLFTPVVARNADALHCQMVDSGITEIVVIFVQPVAPNMPAVDARHCLSVR